MNVSRYMFCWSAAALLMWLFCLASGAHLTAGRWPRWLRFQSNCAALFTKRESDWHQIVYQLKRNEQHGWADVSRASLGPMPVAGYRQRLDRLLATVHSSKSKAKDGIWADFGKWLASRFAEEDGAGPVQRFRIVQTQWKTSIPEMMAPKGPWLVPPLVEIPKNVGLSPVVTFEFTGTDARRVKDDPLPKQATTAKKKPSVSQSADGEHLSRRVIPRRTQASGPSNSTPAPVTSGGPRPAPPLSRPGQ